MLLKSGTGRDRRGTSRPVPATKIRDRTERETAFSSLFLEVGGADNKVYCYIRIYLTMNLNSHCLLLFCALCVCIIFLFLCISFLFQRFAEMKSQNL